jgi:hypothetical protein
MTDDELKMLEIITSLFQELLHPLINLNASVEILIGKVPAQVSQTIDEIGKTSKELKDEVHYLYGNVQRMFNLKSPEDVATQLHQNVLQWKKIENALSYSLDMLQEKITSGFILDDPDLNAVMKEIMFKAYKDYQNLVREIEGFQSGDLLKFIEMRKR